MRRTRYHSATRYRDLFSGDGEAQPDAIELRRPHRTPDGTADVFVPLTQAIATGLLVGAGLAIAASRMAEVDFWQALPVSVLVVAGVSWVVLLNVARGTLWSYELLEFNTPQQEPERQAAEPQSEPQHVLLNSRRGREALMRDEQAQHDEAFEDFIRCCEAVSTSTGYWQPKIGRAQFEAWRQELMNLGYARWRDESSHKQGWVLTNSAERIIEQMYRNEDY